MKSDNKINPCKANHICKEDYAVEYMENEMIEVILPKEKKMKSFVYKRRKNNGI